MWCRKKNTKRKRKPSQTILPVNKSNKQNRGRRTKKKAPRSAKKKRKKKKHTKKCSKIRREGCASLRAKRRPGYRNVNEKPRRRRRRRRRDSGQSEQGLRTENLAKIKGDCCRKLTIRA